MMTQKQSIFFRIGVVAIFMLILAVFSANSTRAEGPRLDSTGGIMGGEIAEGRWQRDASGLKVSGLVSILIYNPKLDTPERLAALGYTVTETFDLWDLVRSNLQDYDVLWIDVGAGVSWGAPNTSDIQAWVQEDGGGVVVTQPNWVGQHNLFPTGFEVYVDSDTWPGWPSSGVFSTLSGLAHPITEGIIEGWDLPGNADWVWEEDIGSSWDILAVDAFMPDDVVALLAGQDGLGRWVYNNGAFNTQAYISASNRFVNQMVCWAAQVAPPPPCQDLDGDGYGDPANPNCDFVQEDCDDTDPEVHPGQTEICDNQIDDDCDGAVDKLDTDCAPEPWSGATSAGASGFGDKQDRGPGIFNLLSPFVFSLGAILLLRTLRRRMGN